MPLGGIVAFVYEKQRVSNARVNTYFDVVMQYLWSGFVITLLILLAFAIMTTPTLVQPSVMVLIGYIIPGYMLRSNYKKQNASGT